MTAVEKMEYSDRSSLLNLELLLDGVAKQITDNNIEFPSQFNFIWHNIQFSGQILDPKKGLDLFSINLTANLGYLPFSSENKAHRKKLFETFSSQLTNGEYILSPNSQIQIILQTQFSGPVDGKRLVEVISYTLLDQQAELKSIQALIMG